jgi:hypothetical protein
MTSPSIRPALSIVLALGAAFSALPSAAQAQVQSVLPFGKTRDLLVGDSAGSQILRIAADSLESGSPVITNYFDPTIAINPATGVPYGPILGIPTAITSDLKGRIYVIGQGAFPRIFSLIDLDGDGNANGPGESRIFLDGSLVANLGNSLSNGLAVDPSGVVWITADGAAGDWVYRCEDLNADGDANDIGEVTEFYNDSTATANGSSPLFDVTWTGFTPSGSLFVTNTASFHQFIVGLQDNSVPPDGDANDLTDITFLYTTISGVTPIGKCTCARFTADGRLFMYNSTAKNLVVAADLNHNGSWSDPGEHHVYAASGSSGITLGAGVCFDLRGDGAIVFGDTGAAARLVVWKDGNANGNANDPGEATIAFSFASTAFPGAQPRSVFFLPAEPEAFGAAVASSTGLPSVLSWDRDGGLPKPGNLQFALQVSQAPAQTATGCLVSASLMPIPLDALAAGLADPNCVLYLNVFDPGFAALGDAVSSDLAGNATIALPLPTWLTSVVGQTFYIQSLVVDGAGPFPVVLTNALSVTIL